MIVEELVAQIGVDFTGLGQIKTAESALSGLRGSLGAVAAVFGGLAAGFAAATVGVAKAVDDYADYGEAVGASVQTLQTLSYAAEQAGGSFSDVQVGLRSLTNLAGEVSKGGTGAAESFAALGVSVRGADGKIAGADVLLDRVAQGLSRLPPGAARVNAAMGVLGKGAIKLLPALSGGAEGLADIRAEAERVGYVMDEESIKQFSELGDALDNFGARAKGLRNLIGKQFLPLVRNAMDRLLATLDKNAQGIARTVANLGRLVAGPIDLLVRAAGLLASAFAKLDEASPMLTRITLIAAGLAAAFSFPAVAVILLAALIGLLADDVASYFRGEKSMLGESIKGWGQFKDNLLELSQTATGFAGVLWSIANALVRVNEIIAKTFSGDKIGAMRELSKAFAGTAIGAGIGNMADVEQSTQDDARLLRASRLAKLAPYSDQGRREILETGLSTTGAPYGIARPAAANSPATTSVNTTINVTGGGDAQDTARKVKEALDPTIDRLTRKAQRARQ